jgi:hypothetical protein
MGDELLTLPFFWVQHSIKGLTTKGIPMAIALSSASQVTASGVRSNKNNSDKGWVDDTINDLMSGFNIGTPPLEDAQEDVSLVF